MSYFKFPVSKQACEEVSQVEVGLLKANTCTEHNLDLGPWKHLSGSDK